MQVETVGEFGREITIPCNLHGVPRPNVTWFRNGKPLSETPNIRFSVGSKGDSNMSEKQINAQGQKRKTTSTTDLKINFLRLEDSGMFQCSASNAFLPMLCSQFFATNVLLPVLCSQCCRYRLRRRPL